MWFDVALDRNTLDLIEGNLVPRAIIELGRAWAFMRGHGLGVFERAARVEISRDAGRPEDVATKLAFETGLGGAAADHFIGVNTVHRPVR